MINTAECMKVTGYAEEVRRTYLNLLENIWFSKLALCKVIKYYKLFGWKSKIPPAESSSSLGPNQMEGSGSLPDHITWAQKMGISIHYPLYLK